MFFIQKRSWRGTAVAGFIVVTFGVGQLLAKADPVPSQAAGFLTSLPKANMIAAKIDVTFGTTNSNRKTFLNSLALGPAPAGVYQVLTYHQSRGWVSHQVRLSLGDVEFLDRHGEPKLGACEGSIFAHRLISVSASTAGGSGLDWNSQDSAPNEGRTPNPAGTPIAPSSADQPLATMTGLLDESSQQGQPLTDANSQSAPSIDPTVAPVPEVAPMQAATTVDDGVQVVSQSTDSNVTPESAVQAAAAPADSFAATSSVSTQVGLTSEDLAMGGQAGYAPGLVQTNPEWLNIFGLAMEAGFYEAGNHNLKQSQAVPEPQELIPAIAAAGLCFLKRKTTRVR